MAPAAAVALPPRAAQTTSAPCSARRVAMAFPMPRDAPVTSATLPARLNKQSFYSRQIVGTAEVENDRIAMDFLHEAAQDRARTYFNIRCDALRRKAPHHGVPADRRRHLRDERLNRALRVAFGLG